MLPHTPYIAFCALSSAVFGVPCCSKKPICKLSTSIQLAVCTQRTRSPPLQWCAYCISERIVQLKGGSIGGGLNASVINADGRRIKIEARYVNASFLHFSVWTWANSGDGQAESWEHIDSQSKNCTIFSWAATCAKENKRVRNNVTQ